MTDKETLQEAVARALCELRIRTIRRHDTPPDELEAMLPAAVNHAWREHLPQADAAIATMFERLRTPSEGMERMQSLSLWLGAGNSDDPADLEQRIRWGVEHQVSATVQRCADIVERLSKAPRTTWGQVKSEILALTAFQQENSDER